MVNIYSFSQMNEVAPLMDAKTFDYISECEVESFESFDDFDLLAFDYYDVRSNDTEDSKTLIYLDNRNLFFFCENNAGVKMIKQIVADIDKNYSNEQLLYSFFVKLLKGDMDCLDKFEERLNYEEAKLLSGAEKDTLDTILDWRNELMRLKRYYLQLDIIFDEMSANDNDLLSKPTLKKISIIGARTVRYLNAVRNLQDIVSQMREAYQSQLEIQQNDLMKVFTVVTTVFLPLNLITGWYGMNFKDMPELSWHYGYGSIIVVCFLIVIFLLYLFKKKKWI